MKIARFFAAGLCLLVPIAARAETWDELTGGPHSWIDPTHWVGDATYPDASDAIADFQVNFGAAMTVELNDSITVGSLLINDTGASGDVALTIAGGTGGNLVFQGASGASATISSSGHIISAATTITSNTDFNIAASSSLGISGDLGGAGIITKSGAGTLALSGAASTYSGSYILSGNNATSVLAVNSDAAFGAVPGAADADYISVTNTNTLRFTAATTMNANRGITINSGATLNVDVGTSTASTIAGVISGSGGLTRVGTQNLTLSGLNTYTGVTTIGAGNFTGIRVSTIGNGGVAGGIGMASSDASNIILNGTAGNAAGILTYTGAGESTDRLFTINQTHGGLEAAGSGTITFTNTGAIAFGSTGSHTLLLQGNNNGSLAALIQDQSVSNKTGLNKSSNGTWTLTGLNTYTGSTNIQGGILSFSVLKDIGVASNIGSDGAISFGNGGSAGGGSVTYTGGATSSNRNFVMNGTGGNSTGGFTHNGTGLVELTYSGNLITASSTGTRTFTLGGSNTELNTFAAKINALGSTVTLTKTGSGTWKLLNGASDYGGATTLNGGVLVVDVLADGGTASSIGASSNTASNLVIHGGTLRYTGGAATTDRLFQIGTSQATIESSGTGALKFTNTNAISQFGGNASRILTLTGTNQNDNTMGVKLTNLGSPTASSSVLSIVKNGTGTWYLTNANDYTGTTTVNGGKLLLKNGQLGNSATTVNNAGSTFGGEGTTLGAVTVNSGAVIAAGDGLGTLGTGTLTMNGSSVFALELNTTTGASDLLNITGNLTLATGNTAILTVTDLGGNVGFDTGYTIINYSGTWTGSRLFTYGGSALADGGSFVLGNNQYTIDYNYDYGDADTATNAVRLTAVAVPEPHGLALVLGVLGIALVIRRRSR